MKGGTEELKKVNFFKPQSEMAEYKSTLEEEFKVRPPATIKEAVSRIQELTGLERSDTQVRKLFKKNGVKTVKSSPDTSQSRHRKASRILRARTPTQN